MKIKCIIVDDEPVARKILSEFIEEIDYLELIAKLENPLKAASFLSENEVDLIFLDINMPKMSGLEFLRSATKLPPVILTTAYIEFALEGFEWNALDYLVKPFSFERFLKACNRAKEHLNLKNEKISPLRADVDHFYVKANGKIEKVLYDELVYAEARQNYVLLHTESKHLIVYLTLKAIEENLPADIFLRIHKSTIINTNKISSIDGNLVNLQDVQLIISQGLHETVMDKLLKGRLVKR
ncbi:MAG: DNA-binding response regulator [Bacteroidetes bacterium]|nr:MAG: DNA-binding response regulator [Bacteroidota bacterium]